MDNFEQLEIPSMCEIKKYLKGTTETAVEFERVPCIYLIYKGFVLIIEAGSYDVTMNEGEMVEMYQVLRNSENTACREDAERKILKQKEDSNQLQDYIKQSEPVKHDEFDEENNYYTDFSPNDPSSSSNKENESDFLDMLDVEKEPSSVKVVADLKSDIDFIDVFDCPPSKHKQMKCVLANPEYEPPFYCNKSVTDKAIKERANMIYSYHLSLNRIYDNFQKQSNSYASWGNAIKPSYHFNGNLLKRGQKFEEAIDNFQINESTVQTNADNVETYISKSGRQTKRRVYNEMEDDDLINDFCDLKKSKPVIAKKNPDTEWHVQSKLFSNATHSNNTSSPIRKRKGINSSSNEEIMKRSRLSLNTSTTTTSRTERLFDSLCEQERERKEKERQIEKFTASLISSDANDDDEEEDQEIDVAELVHIEEPFPSHRIVPPTFSKKQGKSTNQNRSKTPKEETSYELPRSKYQSIEPLTVTRSIAKKKGQCPICNEEFLLNDLETHASTCMEPSEETKMTGFYNNRIMCETCDTVFALDTDYEVHVRECLFRKMRKDKCVL